MSYSARDLAVLVQGTLHGDADRVVSAAGPLHEAGPDMISFLEHERNLRWVEGCRAGVLVVPEGLAENLLPRGLTLIEVADPLLAFVKVVTQLQGPAPALPEGISPQASVHPTASLGPGCRILPFAVIGQGAVLGANCVIHPGAVIGANCILGADVIVYPHAVLYERTKIGNRVIIHAGAVLGADGFGYRLHQGRHVKVPQLGCVEVGDEVEIGANATIDRGTFQATRIGNGTKIDNLVMIAHNCCLGEHNLIVSQVGIAGSTTTGNYVVMAGQVGVADHVTIGDGVQIAASSKVPNDVPAGEKLLGTPAMPVSEARRMLVSLPKLPELIKDMREVKKRLGMHLKEAG
ncbi:MAG: UDP-3-O-(3-hydroxymyristoyl)glucosamine N-acyltransferase [Gemmataceae bacterium]